MKIKAADKILIMLCVALTLPTVAADQSDELFGFSLQELLEVEVKSTSFFDETLLNTSYSVSTAHERDWRARGDRFLGGVLNRMPSTLAPLALGQSRMVAIRGYLDRSSATGTALRYDGIPMNRIREGGGFMNADGYDLALLSSVEQIRGPGSSLHGNDAFHGVVSLQSLDYQESQSHGQFELGSFDYGAVSASTHVQKDTQGLTLGLAYRGIGDVGQEYTYRDRDTGEVSSGYRSNARESKNGLLKYRFDMDRWAFSASALLADFDADQIPGIGNAEGIGDQQGADWSGYQDQTQLLRLGGRYQLSAQTSYQVTAYYWRYQDEFRVGVDIDSDFGSRTGTDREEHHNGLQLHRLHEFSPRSHITVGYEFMNARIDQSEQFFWQADTLLRQQTAEAEVGYSRKLHSFLVDGRQGLTDSVSLTYGLRYDDYSDFDHQYSPRLGVAMSINESQSVYLTYGHAFRAPSTYEFLGANFIAPNPALKPETLDSLELKYVVQQQHLLHQVAVFINQWDEAIRIESYLNDSDPNHLYQFQNIGNNRARGLEYELKGRWQKLQLDFSASYVTSDNLDSQEKYDAFPHWISDVTVGYALNGQLTGFWSARYMERMRDAAALPHVSKASYFRNDLTLIWDLGSIDIEFAVRNIFDRDNSLPSAQAHEGGLADESINLSSHIRYRF